jgi:RsiW-degrading membrane proteinase PrsW (M82 family)
MCFWLLLCGPALGVWRLVKGYQPTVGAYRTALVVGTIGFALYTIPWLFLLRRHNRYAMLPAKLLAVAFTWGALVATYVMAQTANGALLSLYGKVLGHAWVGDWGTGLTAALTEEPAKATTLVLLLGLAPRLVRSPYHGLMIGAFAGLGFQIVEDIQYAYTQAAFYFGVDQVMTALGMVLLRSLVGITAHVLYSAVFCAGLMWLIGRGRAAHRLRGALLMAGAMLLHGLWDNANALGTAMAGRVGVPVVLVLVPAAALALLWLTFRLAVPQERRWLREILAPEAAAGVLSEAELVDATSSRKERRAHRRSLPGQPRRKTAKRLLSAAHRLARQLALSHGDTTDAVTRARDEITRLRTPSPGSPWGVT